MSSSLWSHGGAHQAPLSMEFSRQEYWSGLPFPSPGSSLPRDQTQVSSIADRFLTIWVTSRHNSGYRYMIVLGFLGSTSDIEPACQCRRHKNCGFDSWVRKISWRKPWKPIPVFLRENPMDRGAWWAPPWDHNELDMTEWLTFIQSYPVLYTKLTWNMLQIKT